MLDLDAEGKSDAYTEEEIEEDHIRWKNQHEASFGDDPKDKVVRRIARLTKQELEDIGITAVQAAHSKIKEKRQIKRLNDYSFTGYYQSGTSKMFGLKRKESEITIIKVKGGDHSVLTWYLDPYEQIRFILSILRMSGYNPRKRKDKGWDVYIPKTKRMKSRARL
jgi:hypothetical protein